MRVWLKRCGLFLGTGRGVSASGHSILLGFILAGTGGVLIALSDEINEPIVRIGASVAAFETPNTEIEE